ncbi:GIY-YIG nuclease family protein [Salidesulfovibrio brasiliensis]|uniref:GIY-YIG nuclease family protein n=1 Tax=Salidesulfovibrio brasiliensis TaxID=221711 RepID=UPI0006CF5AF4|nr:GIY-YIG nuclease family protein [Salidesulfovibrio brasiliensis]
MPTSGKTIQIFLPDGNPRGVKVADITSRIIQATLIPRSMLASVSKEYIEGVSLYLLLSDRSETGKPKVYIGETEDGQVRLRQHSKTKDFWQSAIVITSKTQHFTKAHVRFLEWYCWETATAAGRYTVVNTNTPSKPHIQPPAAADLMDNFETIRILTSTLGAPAFDEIKKPKEADILCCKGKKAHAKGEYSEDGLVVFKGSTCNLKETKTAGSWVIGMRQKLIDEETLIPTGDVLEFSSDYIFSSPSAAAATVLARRANGWKEWKYPNGDTLDKRIRQED